MDRRRSGGTHVVRWAMAVVAFAAAAAAEEPEADAPEGLVERLEVESRADDPTGIALAASEGSTGRVDLAGRPKLRPGELVETVPGMIATQHSGGGKANQYFLRGFDLDHGTDFATRVDGVPINLPSHGHGQGYTDLSFLIPELVDAARFRKGPYDAAAGDFSAAGSVDFSLARRLPRDRLQLVGGGGAYGRLLAAGSRSVAEGDLLMAVEALHQDGPWQRPDDFRKLNAVVRYGRGDRRDGWSLTGMLYDGSWRATDQVPQRAVEDGRVDRFGLLDPDLGGRSTRASLSGQWEGGTVDRRTRATAYVLRYDLELSSNFTYFLEDPTLGDEFLQNDTRTTLGARVERERFGRAFGRPLRWRYGSEVRFDRIDNGLFDADGGAARTPVRTDAIDQLGIGVYGEAELHSSERLRWTLGLRADGFSAQVDGDLAANSGTRDDALLSPKLGAAWRVRDDTELYLNVGYGHHSNDARGTTARIDPRTGAALEPIDPLVRARGVDLGLRTTIVRGLHATASLFALELDSELVFVGDGGGTEASRPSRRHGIELTSHYRPRPWLTFELDVALAAAEFTDSDPAGSRIPGSIERAVAAGVGLVDRGRLSGNLRWRYLGGRPLIEDGSVRAGSTSLVHSRLGYRLGRDVELAVEVFNLLDRDDSDIEYFYASRLPGEPAAGIEDVHFHPVEGRSLRVAVDWSF